MPPKSFEIFLDVITKAFLGVEIRYGSETFKLEPTIPRTYDFLRKIESPQNEYERLLSNLGSTFKSAAKTEIYRKNTGWLARGVNQGKIRVVKSDDDLHILPVLRSRRTVGIDSSTVANSMNVLVFASSFQIMILDRYTSTTILVCRKGPSSNGRTLGHTRRSK